MRRINIFLISMLFGIISCDDFFENEPNNESLVLTEDFLVDENSVLKVLNGSYSDALDGTLWGGRIHNLGELLGDNLSLDRLSGDELTNYNRASISFTDYNGQVYIRGYQAITNANLVMENLDLVSDGLRTQVEAEAKFIRAIAHFGLVRVFGKQYVESSASSDLGIPIRLSVAFTPPVRSSVQAVYDQIIEDLKFAELNLAPINSRYERFADVMAAKGFLAKVYFQMNKYQEAFNYSNEVITSGSFSLEVSDTYFQDRHSTMASTEEVFGVISLQDTSGQISNRGGELQGKYRFDGPNIPTYRLSQSLFNLATGDVNDKRAAYYESGVEEKPGLLLAKYNEDLYINVPIVHLTEMHLIRAEVAAELDDLPTAIADLAALTNRAYGLAGRVIPNTKSGLIQEARLQRRLELVGEGDRAYQLKRIGASGESVIIRGASWDCPGMILQFPAIEIGANTNFVRNEEGQCN